jgi:transposase
MEEFARLVDVGNKLRTVTEAVAAVVEAGNILSGGLMRVAKIGQKQEQLAAEINALQLRTLVAAVRVVAELDGRMLAEQVRKIAALGKQSAALDKQAELLAEQTRVAVHMLNVTTADSVVVDSRPTCHTHGQRCTAYGTNVTLACG